MLNIVVVCSLGLGSSFIIESNVRKYFKNKSIEYNVIRADITTAKVYEPDLYICSEDINFKINRKGMEKIELEDLLDEDEFNDKLTIYLKSKGL